MSQSKLESWIESWVNIVVGFTINFFANLLVLPWFGFNITKSDAFWIGVVFTVISLVRSYGIRRLFNRYGSGGWVGLWKTITSNLKKRGPFYKADKKWAKYLKKERENREATTISNAAEQRLP